MTFRSADGNYTVAADVSYEMSVARASVVTPVAKNLTYNGEEQIAFENDTANRYTVGGVFKATDVSAGGYTAVAWRPSLLCAIFPSVFGLRLNPSVSSGAAGPFRQ